MAATNWVRVCRDGERLLVRVNGATIEARSLRCDEHLVTLEFRGIVMPSGGNQVLIADGPASVARRNECTTLDNDPLLDECLW
jgi:hypothetical protein